jgi:sporulation protein YlmC with PRC-barrel domain
MLRSVTALEGYTVRATDGDIGRVHDIYFNDDTWTIRYLVVDTGSWLPGRKVLVSPAALGKPNWDGFIFPVALTRKQVEKSPPIDTAKPVSRQQEIDLTDYYGWPLYWNEPGIGALPTLTSIPPLPVEPVKKKKARKADLHLRSAREVVGYHIHATDGEIGHVKDFVVDDDLWIIRYAVADTNNWLPGKKVLISPQWLGEIHYLERNIDVDLTRAKIKHCPEFDAEALVNREYEERLYDYYGRPVYWREAEPVPK